MAAVPVPAARAVPGRTRPIDDLHPVGSAAERSCRARNVGGTAHRPSPALPGAFRPAA